MTLSQRIYERLLALYPKSYRDVYGPPMAQLFRDQFRIAWRESGWVGGVSVWLRVLPDLARTALVEHLAAMKGKRNMTDKISDVTGRSAAPLRIILRVAVPVFLLVFGLSVILTFLMPESFASTARIILERDVAHLRDQDTARGILGDYDPYFIQTQFEILNSEVVLGKVIESLDLDNLWGKKYGGGKRLESADTIRILRERMTLRPVRNTSLIEIRVYSEDREEAARIANTIAESYREHRHAARLHSTQSGVKVLEARYREQLAQVEKAKAELEALRSAGERLDLTIPRMAPVEIVDRAVPGMKPIRPNKPMNIALGAIGGMLVALLIGGVAALILSQTRKRIPVPTASS